MNRTKILVLEEHPLTRQILVFALGRLGCNNVYTAESADQAFAVLKAEKYIDILIFDIRMPSKDGLSFLREASELGEIAAVILTSSITSDLCVAIQQLARLRGYQVLGTLNKPLCLTVLKQQLLKYCLRVPQVASLQVDEVHSATEIQQALLGGEFIPFYQPKLDLQTLEVVGAEVLVRWQHPRLGLLRPAQFLETVQYYGFLNDMTLRVAREALCFWRELNMTGKMSLSINLEAEQLGLPGLPEIVRQLLEETAVPARCLILELTEAGLLDAPITSIENLVRLRLMGCGVSIDNFGAGFSSLQRICEMPCSELKLDASFAQSVTLNSRTLAIVESLLLLARKLGIQLVVEGVETTEQFSLLSALGCSIGQGDRFSRPLSASSFVAWLQLLEPAPVLMDGV